MYINSLMCLQYQFAVINDSLISLCYIYSITSLWHVLQATQGCPGHQQVSTDPRLRPLASEQGLCSGPCPGGDQQGTGQEGEVTPPPLRPHM